MRCPGDGKEFPEAVHSWARAISSWPRTPIKKRVATGLLKVFASLPQACEGVAKSQINPSLIRDFAYLLDEFYWEATQ